MFVDTHSHLNYESVDAKNTIQDFQKDDIDYVITVSFDKNSSEKNAMLANENDRVYASIGVHPHDASTVDSSVLYAIEKLSHFQKVKAYGEIGLDYHYYSPKDVQKNAFISQLELAHSLKLPIIFHSREATDDTNKILKQYSKYLEYGGVMHCYQNGKELVKFYEDLGLYISFTGVVTFKNAKHTIESAMVVSNDRILTETDCPYMTPEPFRGQTNYPKYVRYVAEKLANIKEMSLSDFCVLAKNNSDRLFRIK